MRLSIFSSITFTFLLSQPVVAELKVPANLPQPEAIKLYKNYLQQQGDKAFAASASGEYGAAWDHSSLQRARQKALEFCQQNSPFKPCKLIDINGDILGDSVDAALLEKTLTAAKTKTWVLPKANKLPYELLSSESQIKGYQQYLTKPGVRAFASSDDGAWGYSFANSSNVQARANALKNCQRHAKTINSCLIRHLNNLQVSYHVAPDWQKIAGIHHLDIGKKTQAWHGRYRLGFKTEEKSGTSLAAHLELHLGDKGFVLKDPRHYLVTGHYTKLGTQILLTAKVGELEPKVFHWSEVGLSPEPAQPIIWHKVNRP